jgi:hypothetical protein
MAAWQVSLGFAIGLPFLYLLLGSVVVGVGVWAVRHRGRLREALPSRRLVVADAAGGAILVGLALLLAIPYLRVLEIYPYFRRSLAWIELYSPPVSGLFIAPAESVPWGHVQEVARADLYIPGEMARLPGFALYGLAAIGLVWSVWPLRVRLGLAAGTIGFAILTVGTNGPADGRLGYLLLMHLPGFDGIRTPGRMIVWVTLLLALLAAGAVGAWGATLRAAGAGRPDWTALAHALVLVPALVVFLEGQGNIPNARVRPAPPTLSTVEAPFLVLPTQEVLDTNVTLWSTDRFAPTVNGGTSQMPEEQRRVRELVVTFPDAPSVDYLRSLGVRSVVVLPYLIGDGPLADAANVPIEGLGLTRQVHPDAVVFTISP